MVNYGRMSWARAFRVTTDLDEADKDIPRRFSLVSRAERTNHGLNLGYTVEGEVTRRRVRIMSSTVVMRVHGHGHEYFPRVTFACLMA